MKKLILAFFIGFSLIITNAKEVYEDVIITKVLYVIDGDTFKCDIDSFPPIVGKNISIRINKIDTPELRSSDPFEKQQAYIEKERLTQLLQNSKKIELRNLRRGKYFRIIADVYIDDKPLISQLNSKYLQ